MECTIAIGSKLPNLRACSITMLTVSSATAILMSSMFILAVAGRVIRARNHHRRPRYSNGINEERCAEFHEIEGHGTIRPTDPVADPASRTSHGRPPCSNGGSRSAIPATSGSPDGTPIPFDTRTATSHERSGNPDDSGSRRTRSASNWTPPGWKARADRAAESTRNGRPNAAAITGYPHVAACARTTGRALPVRR